MTRGTRVISAGLVAALIAPATLGLGALTPTVAVADPSADLAAAKQHMEELGAELSSLQGKLDDAVSNLESTEYQISEKEHQIEENQQELERRQQELGLAMRSSYKSGVESVIDFVLGSTSPEDLVSRIYYLDKVTEQQASDISRVRELEDALKRDRAELEQVRSQQQQQVADMQSQVGEYEQRAAEARTYYENLDAQIQEQLRQQAEAERQAQMQAAMAAIQSPAVQQQGNNNANNTPAPSNNGGDNNDGGGTNQPAPQPTPQPTPQPQPSGPVGGGLGTAYAQIGKPYVWGASGPNAFDCSGLIVYCFGYGRGRTTYAMIDSLKRTGDWKTDMSQLNVGDLVFPNSGHVGIYVGNGRYVHAANPTYGVIEGKLYGFLGGGPY